MRRLRRLLADRGGFALTIEFAMLVPLVFLLGFGTIEAAMMMMVDATMEIAVRTAARYGLASTGTANRDTIISDIIHAGIDRWKGDDGVITIDTKAYSSFANINKPEPFNDANKNGVWDNGETFVDVNGNGKWDPDMGATGAGGSGDTVLYTITLSRPTFTRVLSLVGVEKTTYSRVLAVQNE